MKRLLFGLLIVSCLGFLTATPSFSGEEGHAVASKEKADEKLVICGKCGEFKGCGTCCAADAKVCAGCGLHKDSPGCCTITKGEDAMVCGKCGQIAGTEKCCAENAKVCPGCQMQAGSPGCAAKCKAPASHKGAHSHASKTDA